MTDEEKARLKRQGNYIRHLREQQQMTLEAFADRLDIYPSELDAIERGDVEATDKIIKQLPDISNAYDVDLRNIFGKRWEKLKEKGAQAI